ncbi:MAG: FAD-binding domain-containing protein [Planctomycetota bacterium]
MTLPGTARTLRYSGAGLVSGVTAHIVWFKRDLRTEDHAPLACACAEAVGNSGDHAVVCLAVLEPSVMGADDWAEQHTRHLYASLRELDARLRTLGTRLTVVRGEAVDALRSVVERLREHDALVRLWSHQETGNAITFARDRRVASWARGCGVEWTELPQNGVVRGLRDRDGWAARWQERMDRPIVPDPERVLCVSGAVPGWDFGVIPDTRPDPSRQRAGLTAARETLDSFLSERGVNYRADMASPVTGFDGCSRLSAHLAFGEVSVRRVHHALENRRRALMDEPSSARDPRWLKSLSSFQSRLRWHCHFMQKLETEPAIEHRNMHRAYDGLRTEDSGAWSDEERTRYEAWRDGRTGYPFVDACMRCLLATGWMNFRMRAMLVSFASNHLWLHWRPTGLHLARLFLDYEPGIHWSQMQMQSGTSGINTLRIYNPIKQGQDQDPDGSFIRRWVPELARVDGKAVHEPWKRGGGDQGSLFASDDDAGAYPEPIVDHISAYRTARDRLHAVRKRQDARAESRRVYLKHGSRKGPNDRRYRGGPEDRAMA